jgi:signal transduction histidine kinase
MRDPLSRIPVKYKLALVFLTVCVLAFGVGGYLILGAARGALVREIGARGDEQSRAWASALDIELRALGARAEDFASDGYLRERTARLLAGGGTPDEGLRSELRDHLVRKRPVVAALAGIAIVGPGGQEIAATDSETSDLVRKLPPSLLARETLAFGDLLHEDGRAPRLAIAVPLRSLDGGVLLGRLVNVVSAGMWISRAVVNAGLEKTPSAGLVELAVADARGVTLRIASVLTGPDAPSPESDLARSGFGLTVSVQPPEPRRPDRATWPIAASGWTAAVGMSGPPDHTAVAALQSRVVALGLVLAGVALVLLWFPMRYLARPLLRLREAARRIEGGDFTARVEVESADEIGQAARAFNTMAQAIDERTRRLEKAASDLAAGQAQLRRESDRLAAVISSMRDGLVVLDADGRPVLSNAAAQPLLELVGQRTSSASHHICREEAVHGSCAACLLDTSSPARSCIIDAGRSVLEVHATRLPGDRGAAGRVLVSRDITDRVAQDERHIHQERLAVIGEVASIMAHELNNPLAAISMFAQMMEDELPADSRLREPVAVIRRNTESAKRAIREVLDYATAATPEVTSVDVHDVLGDVSRFLRPMRERAGVELAIERGPETALVSGDEVQIRQIFVNLCMNAIQAMEGMGGKVGIAIRESGDHVEIDVADTGPGIPPEIRDQVFRPFFTTKPRGEGTGLGLPTARRIAEIHGGSLDLLESGPAGTTFRVRLRRGREVPV